MLTADLVRTRRSQGVLHLTLLNAQSRVRALALADQTAALVRNMIGHTREEVNEALASIEVSIKETKLAEGIKKLIFDRCEFDDRGTVDPVQLRQALFLKASQAREQSESADFDRDAVVKAIATQFEQRPSDIEDAFYADLVGLHTLRNVQPFTPKTLIDHYDLYQAQAVLLRARSISVTLNNIAPQALRHLFRQLKFRGLLFTVESRGAAHVLHIDGPVSLFSASGKYGLQLALFLPHLAAMKNWELSAQLRWGAKAEPLAFKLNSEELSISAPHHDDTTTPELEQLREDIKALDGDWKAKPAERIFHAPAVGVLIPDLVFTHKRTKSEVYFEMLGFWSREAVFKRIDAAAKLNEPFLFAVGSKLRVSEQMVDDNASTALYVYKTKMNAKSVVEKLNTLI